MTVPQVHPGVNRISLRKQVMSFIYISVSFDERPITAYLRFAAVSPGRSDSRSEVLASAGKPFCCPWYAVGQHVVLSRAIAFEPCIMLGLNPRPKSSAHLSCVTSKPRNTLPAERYIKAFDHTVLVCWWRKVPPGPRSERIKPRESSPQTVAVEITPELFKCFSLFTACSRLHRIASFCQLTVHQECTRMAGDCPTDPACLRTSLVLDRRGSDKLAL